MRCLRIFEMAKHLLTILSLLLFTLSVTNAYNILVVFSFPIRSLNVLGEGVVKNLLKAGHKVTYVSSFPVLHSFGKGNFTHIDVSSTQKVFENNPLLDISFMMEHSPTETDVWIIQELATLTAVTTFKDANLQQLLADTSIHYDVVIADFVETELYAGLSAVYNCPMIWAYSMGAHSVVVKLVDQPLNPAYTADYTTDSALPFTFEQRVNQLWYQLRWFYYKIFYTLPQEEAIYKETFGPHAAKRGLKLPDYQELIYNASLVISNDHHTLGDVPAVPLSFKFLGGYHIDEPTLPLPKNLQTILDNAKHGAIYFSMGSTWKSKDFPREVKEGLLKMFGELKQTVIWKYEEDLPNTPANVHIVNWAPQQSILAHPNVRLFVMHGGHLSSTEALHFGVPQIGIPVYYDQHVNVKNAVRRGYALSAKLDTNLPSALKPLIQEMLNNSYYTERVKELSWIYHHRPEKPGDELVHWVEHVVKTRGAHHLRSPALSLPFYQRAYLDLAMLIVIALVALAVVVKRCLRMVCRGHSKTHKSKKN